MKDRITRTTLVSKSVTDNKYYCCKRILFFEGTGGTPTLIFNQDTRAESHRNQVPHSKELLSSEISLRQMNLRWMNDIFYVCRFANYRKNTATFDSQTHRLPHQGDRFWEKILWQDPTISAQYVACFSTNSSASYYRYIPIYWLYKAEGLFKI